MQKASETKTITRTVRLAGFEIEEHEHVPLRLLREGPFRWPTSRIRPGWGFWLVFYMPFVFPEHPSASSVLWGR